MSLCVVSHHPSEGNEEVWQIREKKTVNVICRIHALHSRLQVADSQVLFLFLCSYSTNPSYAVGGRRRSTSWRSARDRTGCLEKWAGAVLGVSWRVRRVLAVLGIDDI